MAPRVGLCYRFEDKAEPYRAALRLAGMEPVSLTPGTPPDLAGLAGILLSGGTDVDPSIYGQARHQKTQDSDRERDDYEIAIAREALGNGIPILAICRGMQLLNVVLGGSLIQHLPETGVIHSDRTAIHDIGVEPGTRLAAIVGSSTHQVNSRHHQAVDRLGKGLVITAKAPDGVAEAAEIPGRPVIAVQWHPEDRVEVAPADRSVFEEFAKLVNSTTQEGNRST